MKKIFNKIAFIEIMLLSEKTTYKIWEAALSRSGARITHPRRVILKIIAESRRPLTPQEIYGLAKKRSSGIGLVTVYRTIEKLEALGLVDRVHHSDQCQTVFRSTCGHQHLLICTGCGQSVYFEGLEIEKEFQKTAQALGYQISGHWLQLSGLCPNCQKRRKT